MDGSVWVGLAGTLVGTMIGGGLSIWASVAAQNRQVKATRDLRIEEKAEAAVEEAITQLSVIKLRAREFPQDDQRFGDWEKGLILLAVQMEPTVLRIRDKKLRKQIEEVLGCIGLVRELTDYQEHRGWLLLPWEICSYGLDCLGAGIRDEPLPAPSRAMLKAREINAFLREEIERDEAERRAVHPNA
ncbi:hypothetical protein [Streptomyces sp. NPDC059409]|uniref:hypothetical protein n=1 Tax=Streptomyces sp. NPDC059409 TaxID=3346824 RepID=UPI00369F07A7